ncbi:MAG: hypothetical protein M1836_005569 [Candelina mexicana]|nr:MAG: hypothetical protein M1836_005569 [Candelina mexicana]
MDEDRGLDVTSADHESLSWRKRLDLLGDCTPSETMSQVEQAAHAGSLQFAEVTTKDRETFEEHERWLDNTNLQRENLDTAVEALKITNRQAFRILGMNPNTTLHFWQAIAIHAIFEFHNGHFRGGILADARMTFSHAERSSSSISFLNLLISNQHLRDSS